MTAENTKTFATRWDLEETWYGCEAYRDMKKREDGDWVEFRDSAPDTVAMVHEFHTAFNYEIPDKPCVLGIDTPRAKEILVEAAFNMRDTVSFCKGYLASLPNQNAVPQCIQRVALICEELSELFVAMAQENMVECLDACEDLEYVVAGTIVSLGLAPAHHTAFRRVHASNMSKLRDGEVVKDDHGKVVKGDWYTPVDLSDLV